MNLVRGNLKIRVLCIAFFLLPIMLVTVFAIVLPLFSNSSGELKNKKTLPNESALRLEKAFLSSQIVMANRDSIGLVVDLKDSLIKLAIRGCVIHECSLSTYSFVSGFKNIVKEEFMPLLSGKPLRLKREMASIEKLPIKIKKAPTDTVEAQNSTDDAPGPLETHDVKFMYEFEENVTLEFIQEELFTFKDLPVRFQYFIRRNVSSTIANLKSVFNSEKNKRSLTIRIYIPQKDAIAIYRATPGTLNIAFRF
jgi:hypothetical protein